MVTRSVCVPAAAGAAVVGVVWLGELFCSTHPAERRTRQMRIKSVPFMEGTNVLPEFRLFHFDNILEDDQAGI